MAQSTRGRDLYEVLGVAKSASDSDIKKAYYKLANKFHPDRATDASQKKDYEEKFREATSAYNVLKDSAKRQKYDKYGITDDDQGVPMGGEEAMKVFQQFMGSGGFGSMFSDFGSGGSTFRVSMGGDDDFFGPFGGMGGFGGSQQSASRRTKQQPQQQQAPPKPKGPAKKHDLILTLAQNYKGHSFKRKITRKLANGRSETLEKEIVIKPGMKAGSKYTFAGLGDETQTHSAGDVIFTLKITDEGPDKYYMREDNNLVVTLPISLMEAFEIRQRIYKVTAIDGTSHEIKIGSNEIIHNDTIKSIKGKGMPSTKDPNTFGDLVIKFKINIPSNLENAKRQAILANLT